MNQENIRKILGIFIICLSLLTLAIANILIQISMYLDELTKTFHTDITKYIPFGTYIFISIAIAAGLFLVLSKKDI